MLIRDLLYALRMLRKNPVFAVTGLAITAAGLLIGALLAGAIGRLARDLLPGVSPIDPLTYVCASALLGLVALTACYIPARRAMHVDPMVALRYE